MMCESTEHYFWALGDKIGSGATSDVYKAYQLVTDEIVAAKVSKFRTILPNNQRSDQNDNDKKRDTRSIFDREIDFFQKLNHDNIVRFIDAEFVLSSDDLRALPDRQVLFLEYCNGGSVADMLRLPVNRYGLSENTFIQIMKDTTNGLNYLFQKKIIHRDIKPDNILQSIDINGKITYKLTDFGLARQIKPDESTSDSIRGTLEYVHPDVYCEVYPDIKVVNNAEQVIRTRAQFPFEVEMWAFGVTIYQCSTGQIPFQPFAGTRRDPVTMRRILTSIPPGCISGIQTTSDGDIQWSQTLPEWCRLSSNLKVMLENLLSRLFETKQHRLMKHEDFFIEIEKILNFIPIYYLNLKKFTLTCTYFQADDSINKLFDHIRKENGDESNTDYYCLFQNVHYPISKTDTRSIQTFYNQLPIQPSYEKPLVIYTFSSLKFDKKLVAKVDIPEIQPMKNIEDVFSSVYEWSKNLTGLFFYLKNQLIQYEFIMKLTQSSIITINRYLKTKLLNLLSIIQKQLIDYRPSHELERIVRVIEAKNNSNSTTDQRLVKLNRLIHRTIVKNPQIDENVETDSSESQPLSKIKPMLRLSNNFYEKLIEYEKDLSTIMDLNFNDQVETTTDQQSVFNTSYLLKQMNNYSVLMPKIDKYVNHVLDLNEAFRQDTKINLSSSLQMTSNILRQNLLQELYDQFIHLINEGCCPLILDIFNEYRKWIKQQAKINYELIRIQLSYQDQYKYIIPIDQLRRIINNELEKLSTTSNLIVNNQTSMIRSTINHQNYLQQQLPNVAEVGHRMQTTLEEAKNNTNILNDIMKLLQKQIKSSTIN